VVLVGGVPLAGPQEELRGQGGYTPKGLLQTNFEPRAGGEVRIFRFYSNKQTNEQTNITTTY